MLIYKILRPAEWAALQAEGQSAGAPVDLADGYIHFSTGEQVPGTLARHFDGARGLVLLACETERLGPALRWETSRGGADFPHLYRELRLADVLWHRPIAETETGHDAGVLE